MFMLVIGLVLWTTVHLFPAAAPDARGRLIQKLGLGPYKGAFALLILLSVVLIVVGWQATPPVSLWHPPVFLRHLTILLMLPAMVLIIAGNIPGNAILGKIGHPMLMGVGLWAVAHLLANGEMRSILLFGVLLIWSFREIKMINRRDGKARAVPPGHWPRTMLVLVIGIVAWLGLMIAHPHFTGRSVLAL